MVSYFYTKTFLIIWNVIPYMKSIATEERHRSSSIFVDNIEFFYPICDNVPFYPQIHNEFPLYFWPKVLNVCGIFDIWKFILTFIVVDLCEGLFFLACSLSWDIFIFYHMTAPSLFFFHYFLYNKIRYCFFNKKSKLLRLFH